MEKRRQETARRPGRFRSRRLWILVIAGLLLWTGVLSPGAGANGDDDLDPRRGQSEHPATPATTGPIITDTTIPQALGTASLFMPGFFSVTGANFNPGWRRVSAGGDYRSLTAQMQVYYGILPRTEVYATVPYTHNWAANVDPPAPNGQRRADFGGLGDVSLTGKYLLLEEHPIRPAVAGVLTATLPTGHHCHLNPGNLGTDQLGQGAFSFTPGLNLFKYAPPFLLYANVLYTLSTGATVAGNRLYYPDQVGVNLAMEYPLPGTRLVLLWELVSYFDAGRLLGPRANQSPQALMSTLPGLEFMVNKDFACVAGVLIDLMGKNTTCAVTPNFSVFYYF
jgi:hypothetical protein